MDEDDVYEYFDIDDDTEYCWDCEFCKETKSPRTGYVTYRCSKTRKRVRPYDHCDDYKEEY